MYICTYVHLYICILYKVICKLGETVERLRQSEEESAKTVDVSDCEQRVQQRVRERQRRRRKQLEVKEADKRSRFGGSG